MVNPSQNSAGLDAFLISSFDKDHPNLTGSVIELTQLPSHPPELEIPPPDDDAPPPPPPEEEDVPPPPPVKDKVLPPPPEEEEDVPLPPPPPEEDLLNITEALAMTLPAKPKSASSSAQAALASSKPNDSTEATKSSAAPPKSVDTLRAMLFKLRGQNELELAYIPRKGLMALSDNTIGIIIGVGLCLGFFPGLVVMGMFAWAALESAKRISSSSTGKERLEMALDKSGSDNTPQKLAKSLIAQAEQLSNVTTNRGFEVARAKISTSLSDRDERLGAGVQFLKNTHLKREYYSDFSQRESIDSFKGPLSTGELLPARAKLLAGLEGSIQLTIDELEFQKIEKQQALLSNQPGGLKASLQREIDDISAYQKELRGALTTIHEKRETILKEITLSGLSLSPAAKKEILEALKNPSGTPSQDTDRHLENIETSLQQMRQQIKEKQGWNAGILKPTQKEIHLIDYRIDFLKKELDKGIRPREEIEKEISTLTTNRKTLIMAWNATVELTDNEMVYLDPLPESHKETVEQNKQKIITEQAVGSNRMKTRGERLAARQNEAQNRNAGRPLEQPKILKDSTNLEEASKLLKGIESPRAILADAAGKVDQARKNFDRALARNKPYLTQGELEPVTVAIDKGAAKDLVQVTKGEALFDLVEHQLRPQLLELESLKEFSDLDQARESIEDFIHEDYDSITGIITKSLDKLTDIPGQLDSEIERMKARITDLEITYGSEIQKGREIYESSIAQSRLQPPVIENEAQPSVSKMPPLEAAPKSPKEDWTPKIADAHIKMATDFSEQIKGIVEEARTAKNTPRLKKLEERLNKARQILDQHKATYADSRSRIPVSSQEQQLKAAEDAITKAQTALGLSTESEWHLNAPGGVEQAPPTVINGKVENEEDLQKKLGDARAALSALTADPTAENQNLRPLTQQVDILFAIATHSGNTEAIRRAAHQELEAMRPSLMKIKSLATINGYITKMKWFTDPEWMTKEMPKAEQPQAKPVKPSPSPLSSKVTQPAVPTKPRSLWSSKTKTVRSSSLHPSTAAKTAMPTKPRKELATDPIAKERMKIAKARANLGQPKPLKGESPQELPSGPGKVEQAPLPQAPRSPDDLSLKEMLASGKLQDNPEHEQTIANANEALTGITIEVLKTNKESIEPFLTHADQLFAIANNPDNTTETRQTAQKALVDAQSRFNKLTQLFARDPGWELYIKLNDHIRALKQADYKPKP